MEGISRFESGKRNPNESLEKTDESTEANSAHQEAEKTDQKFGYYDPKIGEMVTTNDAMAADAGAIEAGTAWPTLEGMKEEEIRNAFENFKASLLEDEEKAREFADALDEAVVWAQQYKGDAMNFKEKFKEKLIINQPKLMVGGAVIAGIVTDLLVRVAASVAFGADQLAPVNPALSVFLTYGLMLSTESHFEESSEEKKAQFYTKFYDEHPDIKRIDDTLAMLASS